jgi:peptide/nickel transport system permease protein
MLRYVLKRIGFMAATLLAASFIIFAMGQLLPGDVAEVLLGQDATPESLHEMRKSLGLYDPFYIRYVRWVSGVLRGDLGMSTSIRGYRVSDLLKGHSLNSIFLASFACILVIPVSLLLGIIAGLARNSWVDKFISLGTMIAISVPEFASGILLILFFGLFLKLFPSMSNVDPSVSLVKQWPMLVLPILTLSLVILGYIAKMARASIVEVSRSNYVRTAILKGLPDLQLILNHILRNSLLPSITVIAMNIGWLISGIIVVELVFAYPGMGSLLFFAIVQRDVPLIQATILFAVGAYMFLNFVADILYTFLDPRLRYS